MTKNIIIYNPKKHSIRAGGGEVFLPTFWSQAKTYYDKHVGGDWNWVLPVIDIYGPDEIDIIKNYIKDNPPKIFAISLYVWNAGLCHEVAAWVKQQWPDCLIVSGGPHQFVKTDINWFKHRPYLDASHPHDCYGELELAQMMSQMDQGQLDWSKVDNIWIPIGKTRTPYQRDPDSREVKKNFDYQWPSFAEQKNKLASFIEYAKKHKTNIFFSAILETTRGCPYGCTFCDWGGGISSKVKSKDLEHVEKDIEVLADLGCDGIFLADANFGILEDRDVKITDMLIAERKNKHRFTLEFGGFAKNNKRLDTLKTIFKKISNNELETESGGKQKEIKFSIQSFDEEVLNNIQRTNISLEEYLNIYDFIDHDNPNIRFYVELIAGLPGMTLDKFYDEIDILVRNKLIAIWYYFDLLPGAPAFEPEYIEKFKIKTVKKTNGWDIYHLSSDLRVVIETHTYSKKNYLEMLIAQSWYFCLTKGGILANCLAELQNKYSVGYIIRTLIKTSKFVDYYEDDWQRICNDQTLPATVKVGNKNEAPPRGNQIFLGYLIEALWYWDQEFIAHKTKQCLIELGCNESTIDKDLQNIVNYIDNPDRWGIIMYDYGQKGGLDNMRVMCKT